MEIVYLRERKEHIPTLATWHLGQWAYLHENDSVERRIAEFMDEFGSDGIPRTFVAVSDDVALGSASLILHDMETRMDLSPWLASVFVAPEQRNKGIGSVLVKRVVKEAKDLGYKKLYLFTSDRATFYGRLGWKVMEIVEYYGHQQTIMVIEPLLTK